VMMLPFVVGLSFNAIYVQAQKICTLRVHFHHGERGR
jgi:hypothetical protein